MNALIPCLQYEDAPAAIDFLCRTFGFARQAVHADPENPKIIHHAQLTLGTGPRPAMVMLGSARSGNPFGLRTPQQAGCITMLVYATVDDADAHYARAKAAGAHIVREVRDNEGYPGRSYTARDPEGHVWDFGTYDPWA